MSLEQAAERVVATRKQYEEWRAQHHELIAYPKTPDPDELRRSRAQGKKLYAAFNAALNRLEGEVESAKGGGKK